MENPDLTQLWDQFIAWLKEQFKIKKLEEIFPLEKVKAPEEVKQFLTYIPDAYLDMPTEELEMPPTFRIFQPLLTQVVLNGKGLMNSFQMKGPSSIMFSPNLGGFGLLEFSPNFLFFEPLDARSFCLLSWKMMAIPRVLTLINNDQGIILEILKNGRQVIPTNASLFFQWGTHQAIVPPNDPNYRLFVDALPQRQWVELLNEPLIFSAVDALLFRLENLTPNQFQTFFNLKGYYM